jgi:hypothetical protein
MFIAPTTTNAIMKIYNCVFWNNKDYSSGSAAAITIRGGALNSGSVVSNNVLNANYGSAPTGCTIANNLIDLSSTNTTATKGPQFVNPNTTIGASASFSSGTDLTAINQSDWRLNSSSYLIAKGSATGTALILPTANKDKAGNTFVGTPSAGAYEATATAPTITGITPGSATLSVAFTAPAYDGGATISNYKYSTDGGATWTLANTTSSPFSISGLTNGITYNVQIKAVNANGDGIATPSTAATPKGNQTISFSAPTKIYGDADFAPATATSGLTVTYASSNTAVATIVGGKIHIVGAGTSTITASQAGNSTYNAAPDVQQTLTVNPASQTITFNALPVGKTTSDADFAPGATSATSGINAITYSSSNTAVATIVSGNIHIVGVGTTSITASQASSAYYNAATDVSRSLTIVTTANSDNFRSNASGNWGSAATWQSSSDNTNWGAATLVPTSSAASVTIMNSHTVSVAANATAGALTLNTGSVLNVNAGVQFTVTGALSNSGTMNLRSTQAEGSATLLTSGTVSTGTYNVEQYLDGVRNWYVSSPLSNALAPSGNTYFNYVEAGTNEDLTQSGSSAYWKPIYEGNSLVAGVGYIAKPTSAGLITFSTTTGKINTGEVTVNLTKAGAIKTGFNLCGNPYPANLTFTESMATDANVIPSVWYRTATWVEDAVTPSNSKFVYSFNTFNVLGGPSVSTPIGTTGVIPPMQAFWLRANTANANASSLVLNNSMCTADVSSNPLKTPTVKYSNQQVLRIQLSNGTNNDEAVLYSNPNASNDYDGYDSPKMFNNSASIAEIYSIAGAEDLAINGLNTIPYDTEIALGFNALSAGTFSLKASQISNFEPGTQVILKDYLNPISPVTADLNDGSSFSFTSDVTSNNTSRFALIFHAPQVATGINPAENSNVWISSNANNEIWINGITGETTVTVYNAVGQKILSKNLTKANVQIGSTFTPGVYMITVIAGGKKITRKVIID